MGRFFERLLRAIPVFPYVALGIWLTWQYVTFSGTVWLSDTEINGANISVLYMSSTTTMGVLLLLCARFRDRFTPLTRHRLFPLISGVVSSVGCFIIIIIGPYYLKSFLSDEVILILFYGSGMLTGVGSAGLLLACGWMYGSLTPRRTILYVALSNIIMACLYFIIIGSPRWSLIQGGPSLPGIIVFIGMPILAGFLAMLYSFTRSDSEHKVVFEKSLPQNLWRMVVMTFIFSIVISSLRGSLVVISPVTITLENSTIGMLLRILLAFVIAIFAIGFEGDRINFGKAYSIVMVAAIALVAATALVGIHHVVWSRITDFVFLLFEFLLWCILSFIVFQKQSSSIAIVGYGYGAFALGNGIGWVISAYVFPFISSLGYSMVFFISLTVIVVSASFLLFSEKELDNLFLPQSPDEKRIDDLLSEDLSQTKAAEKTEKPQRFVLAIERIAARGGLTKREMEVLRYLAMGYNTQAISEALNVSWNTVRTHSRNVYYKLNVHSHQELITVVNSEKQLRK